MAACNQRILIVQVEAVVFKIKHSCYTALGKGTVGERVLPLGKH